MKLFKRIKLLHFYYFVIPNIAIISIVFSFFYLIPPKEIHILSGPKGGFFSLVSEELKEGLITKKQFTRMRDKIEGKDKASQLLKSDKELEEKLETIKQLFKKKLITQEEYDAMRKKVLGLN